ncbi:acetyl-CoA C-acyltransferase [Herbaspirillum seropedicae]|uniref:acetyl-CoA C-acyltransferase n=3 Tax=Pseudomonadota TaxID=1224 RepID=D8IVY4_HERSS|nr:acetyl-CoA C-acyltransferase [Herbaspirillum seropedicae]ADJ61782.1 acetyl-CoA acyltransferase protein [Herbaspirillum seropedicae SmR1]AKN63977.1 acetyl-CoA acetyltransferase [Herbaspirillum seropedicae]NQE29352.1 acetyl-CoA acetyltransferase [Herbaspirillum seropedicae]UMU19892.1 acetyl-CoA C-acyltransferase [Herbaspirillum seropedicae]CAM32644.1 Acetyl-CoA acyltransferase protein [Herbaspirillum seropedicae]
MSKQLQDAYIVAATRTPIGKAPRGMFKNTRPDDLLVRAIQSAVAQVPGLDPKLIEDAIVGCSFPEGAQGLNMARNAVLLAGLPNTIGGVTINRYCASGITAIAMAADRIRVGEADVMIAAGAESMSMVPMMGFHPSININAFKDENVGMAYGMGLTAEKVAQQWKVSREAQDEFSLASHQKAIAAQEAGEFADEMTSFEIVERFPNLATGEIDVKTRTVSLDEGPRADSNLAALAKLKPVFAAKGSVTAGNSSQTSDGAGALIIVSEKILKQFNLTPLARFVSFAVRGVPPEIMGIGPKEAIPAALKAGGLTQDQIDWIELNEAFAAQALAVIGDLGLDPSKVNPMGGAIALGHPLGATGAIRAATTIHALRRKNLKYGMVTMCVGTGMGAAGIFERV